MFSICGKFQWKAPTTYTQAPMLRMGFEPMTTVFEREKRLHDKECASTVVGLTKLLQL
jgi:hypothetical protein